MVLYPNKLPESERVCFGICRRLLLIEGTLSASLWKDKDENCQIQLSITADALEFINTGKREGTTSEAESPTDAASNAPVPPVAMPQEDKEDLPF